MDAFQLFSVLGFVMGSMGFVFGLVALVRSGGYTPRYPRGPKAA